MAETHIEHLINGSEDTFWKLFFDPEYNRVLFLEVLRFDAWSISSQDETELRIERVVDAVPPIGDLPGPLKKFVENGAGYRERGSFDKKTKRMNIVVEPSALPGKITVTGVIHTEPLGDHRCKRLYDSTVVAKVMLVGGMIESKIIADMRASYDKAAEFTNQWIADKGL